MEIVTLNQGVSAPVDSDCISIDKLPDGRFSLTGSLLSEDQSVAIVGGASYESRERAEAEGLAWADQNGVECLYVASNS